MRQAHITYPTKDLDYNRAAQLAANLADKDSDVIEPVLVAWYDGKARRMSPAIEERDPRSRSHVYGESHGGKLEIDVAGEYSFVYADSSPFDEYEEGSSPYINLHDAKGNEYLCQTGLMSDTHVPSGEACTPLDEWTSKLT